MSGFEIIAALGFALGAPGVAVAIAQCGQYLRDKIQTIKDTPKIIDDFKSFAEDLHDGQLKIYWELAEWVYKAEDIDTSLKQSFEIALDKLKVLLIAIDNLLNRMVKAKGVKRVMFGTFKSDMKKLRNDIGEWKADFRGSIAIVDIKDRVIPSPVLLTDDKFLPISNQSDGAYSTPLESGSHIWLASGELKESDGLVREVSVLIERQTGDTFTTLEDLKLVASYLVCRVSASPSRRGILECLGYREKPNLEIVFRIPDGLTKPHTLRNLLLSETSRGYGGGHSLNDRLRLARQLSEAVLSIHIAGLVHKNIRSGNIVLFEEKETGEGPSPTGSSSLGLPFLSDWSLLREASQLSARRISQDWTKTVYQHPQRRGLQPQSRYNLGHDVYSLGVSLLEIGLWECLVVERPRRKKPKDTVHLADEVNQGLQIEENEPCMSELYRSMAVKLNIVTEEGSTDTDKLTAPLEVQKILVAIAKEELPPRVGFAFTDLVVSCLTCLEGGMGDPTIFKENATKAAVEYKDAVLRPLSSISF